MDDERRAWNRAWDDATVEAEFGTLSYPWVQPSLHFIERHVVEGAPVLEAGCGPGRLVYWLGELGHHVVGIDCSLSAVAKAHSALPQSRLALADVRLLPFGASAFGTCLSLGVIEHFPEGPDACLAEMRRVLQPQGVLVLCVPHINLLARIGPPLKTIYRWLRRIPLPDPGAVEPPGRRYRRGQLVAALTRNAFEVLETMPFGHAYALHSFCSCFRRKNAYHDVTPLGSRIGRIAERLLPWSMASAVFVAARKRTNAGQGGPINAPGD